MKYILILTIFLLSVNLLFSQEEEIGPISTDRPVQSETATTVPKGFLQVETGGYYQKYTTDSSLLSLGPLFTSDQSFKEETWSGPNMLIKYGLFKWMELRLTINYVDYHLQSITELNSPIIGLGASSVATQSYSGLDAPLLGVKFRLLREKDWVPNATFSLHTKQALWGIEETKPTEQNVIGRLTLNKTLYKSWYIIAGGEYAYTESSGTWFYVLQTGYTFFEKMTLLAEYYGYSGSDVNVSAFNCALVYLLADNHQIDYSIGTGLGDNYYNIYYAIGYSFRLDTRKK